MNAQMVRDRSATGLAVAWVAGRGAGVWGWWCVRWCARHYYWTLGASFAVIVALAVDASLVWPLLIGVGPLVVCATWAGVAPAGYEGWCAGPARRLGWRVMAWRRWRRVAVNCGLAARQVVKRKRDSKSGKRVEVVADVVPRLRWVRARSNVISLFITTRDGQTSEQIAEVVDSRLVIELVMGDLLSVPVTATGVDAYVVVDKVRLGRTQTGADWYLKVHGKSTLIVGASGSGKGSPLWGVIMGLAPAVHVDMCRLYGVDLKEGIELAFGAEMATTFASTVPEAVATLRLLDKIITDRGAVMRGKNRDFTPELGDPLHVLVIDELAELTCYGGSPELRIEADKLLKSILARGRALGVVVIAAVQDPRKEVVAARNLFGQVICLRVKESAETDMVLDAMAKRAPAHLISSLAPGTAWVVDDTGNADRVRADYWPDHVIRSVAVKHPTDIRLQLPALDADDDTPTRAPRRPRSPRRVRPNDNENNKGDGDVWGGAA
jgi:DNA segregation ATPase FtsK/SpoIIIE, S-DNA-T family